MLQLRLPFRCLVFGWLIITIGWTLPACAEKRPVIFIVFDDLFHYDDQRELHGVSIKTPHLDRLKSRAVRFTNAFASIAVCNPSRSSFMTGLSPFRTTVHVPEPTQWNDVMRPEQTITHIMRQSGYETFSTGKVFHNQTRPEQQAFFKEHFDHHFQHRGRRRLPAGKIAHATDEIQADDRHVQWSVDQIRAYDGARTNRQKPMFLSVGIIRPHRPFIAPQRFFDMYPKTALNAEKDIGKEKLDLGDVSDFYKQFRLSDAYQNNLIKKDQVLDFVQGYLACTSYADWQLGQILDAIDSNKNLHDASIIVTSDNGYHLGEKHTWNKFTLWEEAAKVPLLVVDPRLPGGTECDVPVSLLDLAPTIAALGNIESVDAFDGNDLVQIAKNPAKYARRIAITSMIGSLSVRTKKYRLILYNNGSVELYDVQADPRELKNLSRKSESQSLIRSLLSLIKAGVHFQGGVAAPLDSEISGTPKNDTLFVVGNQTGVGGNGDDLYFIADGGRIIEQADGGIDTAFFADQRFEIPLGLERVRTNMFSNNFTFEVTGNAESNHVLVTSSRADIKGVGGDDVLLSGNARDRIDGGAGDDFIWTTGGDQNTLQGGSGTDFIVGGNGSRDTILGDAELRQSDSRASNPSGDVLIGGGLLRLDEADEQLPNGDLKLGGTSLAAISGIAFYRRGQELLVYGNSIRESPSRPQNLQTSRLLAVLDRAIPGDFVVLSKGAGDAFRGSANGDLIIAQNDDDDVQAGSGDDWVLAGGGNDQIHGDDGNDTLDGGPGDDKLFGDRGNDTLTAGGGDDLLSGGAGDDKLIGQAGNDRFVGGPGNDQFTGGPGLDTYTFPSQECVDTVTDFSPRDDKIFLPKDCPLHGLSNEDIIRSHCKFENQTTRLGTPTRGMIFIKRSPNALANAFVRQ